MQFAGTGADISVKACPCLAVATLSSPALLSIYTHKIYEIPKIPIPCLRAGNLPLPQYDLSTLKQRRCPE